jgi:3-oxoadipate enol-lactonase/4-carboxymuconolactone decarboxylase
MTVDLSFDFTPAQTDSAPTVVLLGSLGSDRSMWDPQVGPLSRAANVLAVDLRGHGRSPAPVGPYTIADLGSDVVALLDSRQLDRVHVVGLSMGGAVGQWLAIHHPARVDTLTLLCTAAKFGESSAWTDRAAAVRANGIDSIASAVVDRWFTSELAAREPDLVSRYRAMIAATDDEGYAACCDALSGWDSRADLARISAPTVVVAGEMDPSTPPDTLAVIADGVAGAQFQVLSPAAHLANIEQAGAITQLILGQIDNSAHARGMAVRRSVLGDAHVDRSVAGTTDFTAPFQDFITRTAWGDIWSRPGLDHATRRLLTLAILTAVGNEHELDMHVRAALRAGMDPALLQEVFLHTAVYAGVPNSNRAFALGKAALEEMP